MKQIIVIFVNLLLNALAEFYIFASVFCDNNVTFFKIATILSCVGIVLGLASGFILKTHKLLNITIAISPLLAMGGLFVSGSIEKHDAKAFAMAGSILFIPLIFESGSWILGAFISKSVSE